MSDESSGKQPLGGSSEYKRSAVGSIREGMGGGREGPRKASDYTVDLTPLKGRGWECAGWGRKSR